MQAWQSIVGALITIIVIGYCFSFLLRLVQSKSKKIPSYDVLTGSSLDHFSSPKKGTPLNKKSLAQSNERSSSFDQEAGQFVKKRHEEDTARVIAEQESARKVAEREAELDRDLAQWLEAEQAEVTRTATIQAAAEEEQRRESVAKKIASTQTILDWLDQRQGEDGSAELWSKTAPGNNRNVTKAKQKIVAAVQAIEKEKEDLEYVITRLETGIDFVSMEVKETIDRWKKGQIHRRSTLEDLKRKFRLKTYSIDDGWELFFIYPDWLIKQREKLFEYVESLGAAVDRTENILAVIERAEKLEWKKNLDLDMDVIFLLKEVRKMHQIMLTMENRLAALEVACKKRSDQVIAPSWEPRGIL